VNAAPAEFFVAPLDVDRKLSGGWFSVLGKNSNLLTTSR